MLADLAEIFARHQEDGRIAFPYDTTVFVGGCCRRARDDGAARESGRVEARGGGGTSTGRPRSASATPGVRDGQGARPGELRLAVLTPPRRVPSSICDPALRRRSEGLFLLSLGGRVASAVPRPAARAEIGDLNRRQSAGLCRGLHRAPGLAAAAGAARAGRPSVEAIAVEVEVAVAFMLRAAAHSPARADEPGRRPDAATTADRGVEADTPIPERISGVS
jgi:hypothetical protein